MTGLNKAEMTPSPNSAVKSSGKEEEEKRGSRESANREGDQRASLRFAEPEQDQRGEHVAHEIIVEDGKKLAPE